MFLLSPDPLFAQSSATLPSPTELTQPHFDEPDPQPTLTSNGTWAGSLLCAVAAMFAAAAIIGPIVRANAPRQPPKPDSHH